MGKSKSESKTKSTSEQSTRIAPAGGDEQALRAQLLKLVTDAGLQLGDLSGLASGADLSPTASDIELANTVADASTGRAFAEQRRGLESSLISRGVEGGTVEAVDEALLRGDQAATRSGLVSQILLDQPLQRAQVQLSANQVLFQRLMGAANPALQASLAERLAQTNIKGKGFSRTEGEEDPGALGVIAALKPDIALVNSG